jgi:hypothetical protein
MSTAEVMLSRGDRDDAITTPELRADDFESEPAAPRFALTSPVPATSELQTGSAFRPVPIPASPATDVEGVDSKEARRQRKRKAAECGDLTGCGNCEPARQWKKTKSEDEHDPYQCPVCLRTTANSPAVVSCKCTKFQRYHIGCYAEHLKRNRSCPLCRAPVTECWIVGLVQIYEGVAIKNFCYHETINSYRRWSTFLKILYKLQTGTDLTFDVKDAAFCGVYLVPQLVQTILNQFMMVTFTVDQFVMAYETFLSHVRRDIFKMEKKVKMSKLFLQNECAS